MCIKCSFFYENMFQYRTQSSLIFYFEILFFIFGGKNVGSDKQHFNIGSLTASLPPWITSIFEAAYFVPLSHSSPLNLKCKAQNGNISYRWFKDNDKLHTNDRVVVNEQSGDITFRNLIKKDFGLYYCVAENKHGSSVSSFVKILEAALGVFGGITNKTIACKVFHHCKISCSNKPNCQPINECKFEWKSGAATANTIITNENIAIDSEGDLHFLNFNRSYASHDLSCGIWNEKLRIFTKGSFYTVEINEHNSTAISQSIWKNNPKAVIGENATLQCIFSGRVICKTNEYTPEEVVEVEEDRAYSDPVIELSENIYSSCCDEELSYDTPQMMPSVDNPDHYYNSLRECIGEQADNNCYDCADNVSGIYNISFRRNSHTMMRLSDNLRSVERCKDT
ncbi:contactin-3 [Magallana gigas]|uniref:contactin-3 n=1 Tax=Magallana gigas TaxID=29159 RepID=UPI0033402FA8